MPHDDEGILEVKVKGFCKGILEVLCIPFLALVGLEGELNEKMTVIFVSPQIIFAHKGINLAEQKESQRGYCAENSIIAWIYNYKYV